MSKSERVRTRSLSLTPRFAPRGAHARLSGLTSGWPFPVPFVEYCTGGVCTVIMMKRAAIHSVLTVSLLTLGKTAVTSLLTRPFFEARTALATCYPTPRDEGETAPGQQDTRKVAMSSSLSCTCVP